MYFLNTAEKRDRRLVHLPMGRFGEAVEIAKGALFCASASTNLCAMNCAIGTDAALLQWRATTAAT